MASQGPTTDTIVPATPQFVTAETLRVAAIMQRFDRRQLAAFVTVAIDLFDGEDGDPDIEANGDETDHCHSEDCFIDHRPYGAGPGCPIADPDYGGEEDGEQEEGV